MRRVAVTGIGLVTGAGNDVASSWAAAVNGKSAIRTIERFDPAALPVRIAAEVKGLDAEEVLDPKEAKRATRFVQFAAKASQEALTQSGLDPHNENTDRWGVSIGVGIGALHAIEKTTLILNEKGPKRVSPFFMPYTIANMASGIVSRRSHLRGPNLCTTTACTSGTHAIGEAFLYLKSGMADVMIAGGSEAAVSPLSIAAFAAMKALSTRNEDQGQASRPFDKDRDGFVMGEGAGLLVLEDWERAQKRGANIFAELVGYGMSSDAHHITAPSPAGEGAQRCMKLALETAQLSSEAISYVNAHGTSTPLNDKYETQAIQAVFGPHADKLAISSTKGVTGHCLGAAGGIEAAFAVLALHHGIVPPTANYRTPDPECPLDYTPKGPREMSIRYALSNSFGFGGTNGTLIFKHA